MLNTNNSNNIVSDSVVEKIRKLLALGTSCNEHESALALAKAKSLAESHDVDIALISIFEKKKTQEPIIRDDISLGQRKLVTQRYVSWILENHFKVKIIYSGARHCGFSMVLIGTKDNIAIAQYVQSFLNQEFMRLWHNYFETTNCPVSYRGSYLLGLYNGLNKKLQDEQKSVVEEKLSSHTQETRNQFALMVTSEKERLNKSVAQFFDLGKLKKGAKFIVKSVSVDAIDAGMYDGEKINIRRAIANTYAENQIAA